MPTYRVVTKQELEAFIDKPDKLIKGIIAEKIEFLEKKEKQLKELRDYFELEMGVWKKDASDPSGFKFYPGLQEKKALSIVASLEDKKKMYKEQWSEFGEMVDKVKSGELNPKAVGQIFASYTGGRAETTNKLMRLLEIVRGAGEIMEIIKGFNTFEFRLNDLNFDKIITEITETITKLKKVGEEMKYLVDLYESSLFKNAPAGKPMVITTEHENLMSHLQFVELHTLTKSTGTIVKLMKKYDELYEKVVHNIKYIENHIVRPLNDLNQLLRGL